MIQLPLGLGWDDLIFGIVAIVGIYIIRFWLIKIYNRVRQIAKIMEHILEESERED